jgi:hypothetical protein
VVGEVLRRGVPGQEIGLLTLDHLERPARLGVVLPDDEPVVPRALDPAADAFLQHAEVDDTADRVEVVGRGGDERDEVVPVQVAALPFVPEHTVTCCELDATGGRDHDRSWMLSR